MPRWKPCQLLRPIGLLTWSCFLVTILHNRFKQDAHTPTPLCRGSHVANSTEARHGFMPLQEAEECYQRRWWDIYATRDQPRKVYDLFLINTELEWLEIRLNELWDEVDYFVILEAATRFQEGSKPLRLLNSWSQFQPFHSDMIHHVVNMT